MYRLLAVSNLRCLENLPCAIRLQGVPFAKHRESDSVRVPKPHEEAHHA